MSLVLDNDNLLRKSVFTFAHDTPTPFIIRSHITRSNSNHTTVVALFFFDRLRFLLTIESSSKQRFHVSKRNFFSQQPTVSSIMSDALNVMKRARENEYFIKEQEREIAEYILKLKSEGRYEEAMRRVSSSLTSSSSSGSGALPQVLAHSVRLFDKKFTMKEEVNSKKLDRDFIKKHSISGACTGNPVFIGHATLGSRVSLGKSKWSGSTQAVEGTSIFSVHKAMELMESAPERFNGVESRAAKHMRDETFVMIGKKKVKLLPDPTPGRALAWGGTLALWGTGAVVLTSCKFLGINSLQDVNNVMKRTLDPLAKRVKDTFTPLRTNFEKTEWFEQSQNADKFSGSHFAMDLKRKFAI